MSNKLTTMANEAATSSVSYIIKEEINGMTCLFLTEPNRWSITLSTLEPWIHLFTDGVMFDPDNLPLHQRSKGQSEPLAPCHSFIKPLCFISMQLYELEHAETGFTFGPERQTQ